MKVSWPKIFLASGCSRSIRAGQPITSNASNVAYALGEFDSTTGYRAALTNGSGNLVTNTFASALPASIEVAVVAVDARTARRLTGTERPGARSSTNLWDDLNAFYTNFRRESGRERASTAP